MVDKIKEAYHTLIRKEWEIYESQKTFNKVFLTEENLQDLKLSKDTIEDLLNEGLLLKLAENKYRTLLMDLAYRASDIRIRHNGTKYVLESSLKLLSRPVLDYSYLSFDRESNELANFKSLVMEILKDKKLVDSFLESLREAGIKGLSRYQYWSIIKFLTETKDVIISAPTAFGKTYCFIIPVLIEALNRAKEEKRDPLAIIFYPRKSLGSDQMGKLIRLIYQINNRCRTKITIGIDDGDTKNERELKNGDIFRGIKCPVHPDKTLKIKDRKVFCDSCNSYFDFIYVSREEFQKNPPLIIITNVWAYQYRLSDPIYWRNGYLNANVKFFIFDEIHAYRSLVAGIIRYLIRINKKFVSPNSRLVISSATIPKLEEFVYEITGNPLGDMLTLVYDEKYHAKDDEKLELYLLIGINPLASWETYTHELAIFLSTVNRLREKKNLQSLVFVDSIRNINRLYDQMRESIKLGDPTDHLNYIIPPEDAFCYWLYNQKFKLDTTNQNSKKMIEELRNEILEHVKYHYSQLPERFEVEENIRKGNVDVVFTTSTLELGVDYDNVSVVVNAGIPNTSESIVQRIGRAGRNKTITLNTSLSIIIIRNNPLEYFYIYKGLNNLLDLEAMPKIPVSYTNQFVIFYSIMLYIISLFAKNNNIKNKDNIRILEAILDYFNKNKDFILKDLGISSDISMLKNDIESLINIIKNNDMNKVCREIYSYINSIYLQAELEDYRDELDELINITEKKIGDLPNREKKNFMENLGGLKDCSKKLKETKSLKEKSVVIGDIIAYLDNIKNSIRSDVSPMRELRNEFFKMSASAEDYFNKMEDIISVSLNFNDKEYSLYLKACEIYRNLSNNIIRTVEDIIGFRFMGNEFIDHKVNIKPELSFEAKEEFLTNIMARMPPFELIKIPFESKVDREITEKVGARHFWFPKTKKRIYFLVWNNDSKKFNTALNNNYLLSGSTTKFKDLVIPDTIQFIDILSYSFPLIIKMHTNNNPLYIKYGSDRITDTKVMGKYSLHENIQKIYTLDPNTPNYRKIHNVTRDHLATLDRKIIDNGNPWGINFRYVAYCTLGRCLSTDPLDLQCPKQVQSDCRLCDGKKFWNKLRKPFPKVYIKPNVKNVPNIQSPLIFSLDTITYEEIKEEIEFIYDKICFYLPIKFGDYLLREIELEPLGYLAKTSLISLKFNLEFIKIFIDQVLKQNSELTELLKLKYYLYNEYRIKQSSSDAALGLLNYNSKEINIYSDEFVQFVKRSLIHSLTHLFYIFLSIEKINIDPERMVYFIEDGNIYILENSKNDGIGLVETVRSEILKKGQKKLLDEFYHWCDAFLKEHNEHTFNAEKEIKNESKKFIEKLRADKEIGEKIKEILEELDTLNKKIESRTVLKTLDLVTYRYILSQELDIPEELTEYLLIAVNSQEYPSLCYDGCNECLILQNECSEPFSQIYLLSKQLVLEFIKTVLQGNITIVKKGVGAIIEDLIKKSNLIVIKTPFIDDFGVNLLATLNKEGKKVRLIVREIKQDQLEYLRKAGVEITVTSEKTHAKIYYFKDENEEVCIHGSANLTKNSFYENEENLTVIWDKNQIQRILKDIK